MKPDIVKEIERVLRGSYTSRQSTLVCWMG
jgi:hypothetical protein